jgi:hypothetical protein
MTVETMSDTTKALQAVLDSIQENDFYGAFEAREIDGIAVGLRDLHAVCVSVNLSLITSECMNQSLRNFISIPWDV